METEIPSAKAIKYAEDREKRIARRRLLDVELNERFLSYYRSTLFASDAQTTAESSEAIDCNAGSWEKFTEILRVPLHVVFRVEETHPLSTEVMGLLADIQVAAPCQILPSNLAYQCSNANFDFPRLKQVFQLLNASALITFQESVSMIPSIALIRSLKQNAQKEGSGPYILDMCAAPGSKSLHFLDALYSQFDSRGVLVSVEKDPVKATQTLPARLKRAQSPCCLAVQGDATRFPSLYCPTEGKQILFDGVLCDVPCSGDGTSRKDNTIQKRWDENFAVKLHPKQRAIFHRGLELVNSNGYCVYSTCSLNPIENECVFTRTIDEFGSSFVTVENIPSVVPEFRFSPAISLAEIHGSHQVFETLENQINRVNGESAFTFAKAADTLRINPDYLGRALPHVNNSGGFFTTLLKRTAVSPATTDMVPSDTISHHAYPNSFSHWGAHKNFRDLNEKEEKFLAEFYGIDAGKLEESYGLRLIVHGVNDEKPKRILLLSKECYSLLHCLLRKAKKERITHVGVRVFSFWQSKLFSGDYHIPFRTTYEGARHLGALSNGSRTLHLCVMKHLSLVHLLLQKGIAESSTLTEVYQESNGSPIALIGDCISSLEPKCFNPYILSVFERHCLKDKHIEGAPDCGNGMEGHIAPGPLWIAIHLSCLRNAQGSKRNNLGDFGKKDVFGPKSILWLSGVLYFTRLEITTKEPIRKGISIVLHQSLSGLL
ncbi:methyltransferase [Perkinsela sp. CCAP 1560/4]|nr:methyltransferase [Perkinsela sp. CCAP 1560/4]|eukprot:KNH09565.1 methyltransferase [Perkinsela sp. CCAP 1560/4]